MRSHLLLVAKIAVSAALLYIALRGVDLSTVLSRINQIDPLWIVLAIVATFLQLVVSALRWRLIAIRCDAVLSAMQALRYIMIGAFFSLTLPSTIGGDAVRLWLTARTGAGLRKAAYSVLIDRAIGLMALAVFVIASLPWSLELISNHTGRVMLIVTGLVSIGAGVGFLLVGRVNWTWLSNFVATRDIHGCSVAANRVMFRSGIGGRLLTLSALNPVLGVAAVWAVARAIGAHASFMDLFFLFPPVVLITMIPISISGWGLRETTMMVAFGYAGLPQADGLVTSILLGIVVFIVGAVGGIVWVSSPEKSAKHTEPLPAGD